MKYKMVNKYFFVIAIMFLSGLTMQSIAGEETLPNRAEDVCPLLVGQSLPSANLKTVDGKAFDLNAAISEKPTVLIFFRGGWCPYCNKHLGQLQSIELELIKLGFQIIAISPDRPGLLKGEAEKKGIMYRLLSDSDMSVAKSLGIAFRLDDKTVKMYKASYGIDIEGDSGEDHHLLPVPSVFVIGKDNVIQFSYVNPNYKVRLNPSLLLKVAETIELP